MNANSTKREIWIDNCKVIAIFLVVFGHLIEQFPYIHSQFPTLLIVTTIHMPIFFFCSGYLFKPIKIKTALKNDISIGLGTDTGCPFVTHYNFYRELVYFQNTFYVTCFFL